MESCAACNYVARRDVRYGGLQLNENAMNEKRWVSTLMVDIVGSTELVNKIGSEDTFKVVQGLLRDVVETIKAFEGYPVDFAGDSVFAIFGAPIAVENASVAACETAFKIMHDVERKVQSIHEKYDVSPGLRVGIGGGEVLIASLDVTEQIKLNALGPAVNLAARLQGAANPGEIYCSEEVFHEVDGFAHAIKVGSFDFKGFDKPVTAYCLKDIYGDKTSLESRKSRGAQDYVGREDEIANFQNWLLDPAPQSNAMLICGPAGIGKSRFIQQALEGSGEVQNTVFVNCSVAGKNAPFAALAQIVRVYTSGSGGHQDGEFASRIRNLTTGGQTVSEKTIALLLEEKREIKDNDAINIRRDLAFLFDKIATQSNTRIILEDIHWLDQQSAELIRSFLTSRRQHDKIIFTSRYHDDFDWCEKVFPNPLRLVPLAQENIDVMFRQMLPDLEETEELRTTVYQRSEGNPLFAEEILRHIKLRLEQSEGAPKDLVPSVQQSGSLQNLIFARFDLLAHDIKTSLKFAAVIDRKITVAYLEAFSGSKQAAQQVIAHGVGRGLVEFSPEAEEYQFAHALVRDAILGSLPREQKQALHSRAAQVIKGCASSDADINGPLAFHHQQAGEIPQAMEYLFGAACCALDVYALATCDKLMEQYAELADGLGPELEPDRLAEALFVWCRCLDIFGNFKKLVLVVQKYSTHLEKSSNVFARTVSNALYGKAMCIGGQIEASLPIIENAEQDARASGDAFALAHVKSLKLWTLIDHPTDYQDIIGQLLAEVNAAAEVHDDDHLRQVGMHMAILRHRVLGDMKKMDIEIQRLIDFGTAHDNKWALAYAKWSGAISAHIKGDLDLATKEATETLSFAIPGTVDWQAAQFFLTAAHSMSGKSDVDVDQFEAQYQKCLDFGDHVFASPVGQQAAVRLILDGQLRAGWARLSQASQFVYAAGHKGSIYRQHLATGEFLLTLAGLLPSKTTRPKMGPLDIVKAISLRISAVKRAEEQFQQYFAFRQGEAGFFDADAYLGLGLIAKSRKQSELADTHFAAAAAIYAQQDYAPGLEKVEGLRTR